VRDYTREKIYDFSAREADVGFGEVNSPTPTLYSPKIPHPNSTPRIPHPTTANPWGPRSTTSFRREVVSAAAT
jgi:hypothetical protein